MEGFVSIPRLKVRGFVSFCIDTGSDTSVLMPVDAEKLGIDFSTLINPSTSVGIGGDSRTFLDDAIVAFGGGKTVYLYRIEMEIQPRTDYNAEFPSLLGRDITDHWSMTLSCPLKRVHAKVRHADEISRVKNQ
jgi:hypothetical protein